MEIIIDTNIIFNDWLLRSEDSRAFLDFVERTGSIIYIPRIVWEETIKNYKNEITNKHTAYVKASKQFGRILIDQPDLKKVELDFDEEVSKYANWLKTNLKLEDINNILPYGNFTERIANRAMSKRKPFNMQNNNEYKDTLIWETVLDVVSTQTGRGDDEVVFISNDSNAFGPGRSGTEPNNHVRNQKGQRQKGALDPQLEEDINYALEKGRASNFYYYESFAEFLASHYTPIKGIDEESVRNYLWQEESGFKFLLLKELLSKHEELTTAIQATNPAFNISLNPEPITIDNTSYIQDFYLYPFQKGEIVTASGTIYVFLTVHISYNYTNKNNKLLSKISPILEVKFNLPYIDKTPADIHFESINIHSGLDIESSIIDTIDTQPLTATISKIPGSSRANGGMYQIVAKLLNALYDQPKPELFTIEWGEYDSEKEIKLSKHMSNGGNSKYIPSTGKSQPFIRFNSSISKRNMRRKK